MGKHTATAPPKKVSTFVKFICHGGTHCAATIALHVIALFILGKLTPILTIIGVVAH